MKAGPRPQPPKDAELLAKCNVLKRELASGEDRPQQAKHRDEEGHGV